MPNQDGLLQTQLIYGRNAVFEALRSEKTIDRILLSADSGKGSIGRIVALAREKGVPIKDVSPVKLDQICAGAAHQGVAAFLASAEYSEMEDVWNLARTREEPLFLLVADEIEDPHNLGALMRTAECCGAHGIVIPKRRSAGLSATVYKSSAGAAGHLPVVRVSNLAAFLEELKKQNVWLYCADMDGQNWCQTDFGGHVALVVGNEGHGVSRLVKEKCDFSVSLPMQGKIDSLNASVAGGVLMYEIARQRLGIPAK